MNDGNTNLKIIIFSLLYADDLQASSLQHAEIMKGFWERGRKDDLK